MKLLCTAIIAALATGITALPRLELRDGPAPSEEDCDYFCDKTEPVCPEGYELKEHVNDCWKCCLAPHTVARNEPRNRPDEPIGNAANRGAPDNTVSQPEENKPAPLKHGGRSELDTRSPDDSTEIEVEIKTKEERAVPGTDVSRKDSTDPRPRENTPAPWKDGGGSKPDKRGPDDLTESEVAVERKTKEERGVPRIKIDATAGKDKFGARPAFGKSTHA